MNRYTGFSLLQPVGADIKYCRLPEQVMHDLGLEAFCNAISSDAQERRLITNILSQITDDVNVATYRQQIFTDIFRLPELRKTMMELFDKIKFLQDFSTMHRTSDEELGLWHFFHRLDELDDYIKIVETIMNIDDDFVSYDMTSQLLKKHPEINALFFAAGGVYGGCRSVLAQNRAKDMTIITFDQVDTTKEMIMKDVISATICQEPFVQGSRPLDILFTYLATGELPEQEYNYTAVDIRIKENLD